MKLVELADFSDLAVYRRHFMDPQVWAPLALRACRAAELPTGPVRPGLPGTYPTMLVGGRWVVKFFGRLFDGQAAFETEQAAGLILAQAPEIPTAQVRAVGELGADARGWRWPYLIFDLIPGVSLGEELTRLSWDEKTRLASELGGWVRRLHSLPLPTEGVLRGDWGPFLVFVEEQRRNCVERQRAWGHLPAAWLAQVEDFLPPAEELVDTSRAPCLAHADLTRDHLLGELRDRRWVTRGWIDFGDARAACPAYELPALFMDLFEGQPALLRAFLRAYGWPENDRFWRDLLAWILLFPFDLFGMLLEQIPAATSARTLDELADLLGSTRY